MKQTNKTKKGVPRNTHRAISTISTLVALCVIVLLVALLFPISDPPSYGRQRSMGEEQPISESDKRETQNHFVFSALPWQQKILYGSLALISMGLGATVVVMASQFKARRHHNNFSPHRASPRQIGQGEATAPATKPLPSPK